MSDSEKKHTILGVLLLVVTFVWTAPFVLLYVLWRWWVESVWKGNPYP